MSSSPENTLQPEAVWPRLVPAWLVGSVAAYFLTSFFSNFYPFAYQFVLLSLFFQLLCGMGIFLVSSSIRQNPQTEKHMDWIAALAMLVAFLVSAAAVVMAWQFPGLFRRQLLFMDSSRLRLFVLLSVFSLGALILLIKRTNWAAFTERLVPARILEFMHENWPGILLAIFFFLTYFVFAATINFPQFRTLDLYFDTDISEWLARLTATTRRDVSMVRAVHPAVLLFLRPPVWLISLFLNGDRLHAVFMMNAMAGAACVMLAWLIIKRASGRTAYSLIMASLLGASSSHLLLSSMLETYIYSALALLFFVFLLQTGKTSLRYTVPAGVLVFGITVTNIMQTCILYLFNTPRPKVIIKFVIIVVIITVVLNVVQVWMYPNARPIFQPSNLLHEERYVFDPFEFSWRTSGRFHLISRAILLYGVVAPTPFILTQELGMDVPNFRTYQILLGEFHIAGYRGFADVTVKFWMLILALAGMVFILNLFRAPRQMLLPLSLLTCLGFSFVLHLFYGDDPVLYSPNWVYALILFVALALQRWAEERWLQLLMILFLVLLITTNLGLIHQIMEVSATFYGQ